MNAKLGKATDQRMAIVKNQVTDLLWYGKLETTAARAKSVASYAEKVLTAAIGAYTDTIKETKVTKDAKGKEVKKEVYKDGPKKLAARRRIMTKLYDKQEPKFRNEGVTEYKARTKGIAHPLIEKIFNELAPKYDEMAKKSGTGGGYTRIIKACPRRGDGAEVAIIELI